MVHIAVGDSHVAVAQEMADEKSVASSLRGKSSDHVL
ncbi:hypothetical protein PsW74_01324 [Pseudovibrio sp. W74]|nr:hypothetical protein PsW74_01324 [Pseudovibrio sp. W74]